MMGKVITWVILVLIYVLVVDSITLSDYIMGGIVALGLLLIFHHFVFPLSQEAGSKKPFPIFSFLLFIGAVTWMTITGTWDVLLTVLGIRSVSYSGLIEIPCDEMTNVGAGVFSLAVSISPGSVLIDLDYEKKVMTFHLINVQDPEKVLKVFRDFYQRYQKPVFP